MALKHSLLAAGLALALAPTVATATTVTELEPNNALSSAQFISNSDPSIVIIGSRTFADPSDDFYSFQVLASGLLSIISSSPDGAADSIMGLYNAAGMLVASNDDGSGIGSMSAIQFSVPVGMSGRYSIGFSGFNPGLLACSATVTACYDTNGDFIFDTFVAGGGSGGSTGWNYAINVGGAALVPEPGAWLLLAMGLPLLLAMRRRRHSS